MNDITNHPLAMDGKDPSNLRGDPIDQERYYSKDFMAQEWEHERILASRETFLNNFIDRVLLWEFLSLTGTVRVEL